MFAIDAWNYVISLSLFAMMLATLVGTITLYVTYKVREKMSGVHRPLESATTPSPQKIERPKIRFG